MKKNNALKVGIIITVLFLGVVYAAITTNLDISGSTQVQGDDSNFKSNVIFDSVTASTGSTATLSTDKKTITFTTAELSTVDSTAVLTYKIKNTSNYQASVAKVTCTAKTETTAYSTYLTVTPSRTSTLTVNKGATSSAETITVKLIKAYPDEDVKSITFTCTMTATAKASA